MSENILSVPMEGNDAGAATVGEYLAELLITLLRQEEGFSGKRPFGDSGWQHFIRDAIGDADDADIEVAIRAALAGTE